MSLLPPSDSQPRDDDPSDIDDLDADGEAVPQPPNDHISLLFDTLLNEAQRFYQFVHEIILPFEPHGFRPHSSFHKQLIYSACCDLSATAAPRGHLKSTIFSRYRALHRLVDPDAALLPEGVNVEVMLLSETDDLACEHLAWIKNQIDKNPHLIARYGRLKADETERMAWGADAIQLTNGNRAYALGYRSQIRSRHPTDIFVDDLESERNLTSPEMIKKLKDWFYRSLMGSMLPETRLAVIGTIITKDSLLDELAGKVEFRGKIWKALNKDDNGEWFSLWPERWSVAALLKKKAVWGTHRFNAEFQNEPLGMKDPIILEEWIRRHSDDELARATVVARYIGVDVAVTEERWGADSAIIVLDETRDGRLPVRMPWKRKVTAPVLIRSIIAFWNQFKSNVPRIFLGVEDAAQQKFVRQHIQEQDPTIPVTPMPADKDKVRRLIDVSRYFEMGLVSISERDESLVEEILNFPMGAKDRVDALVHALKLYEQQHPVLLDGGQEEVDRLENLSQDQLNLYIERSMAGIPGYELPSKWRDVYVDAQAISEFVDDEMNG